MNLRGEISSQPATAMQNNAVLNEPNQARKKSVRKRKEIVEETDNKIVFLVPPML